MPAKKTIKGVRVKLVDAPADDTSELDEVLAQFDNVGITARLSRYNEAVSPKRWDYVGTIEPVTPTIEDDVKERFGGGSYRMRLYKDGVYLKGKGYVTFSINGRPKDADASAVHASPAQPQKSTEEKIKEWVPLGVAVSTAIATIIGALKPAPSTAPAGPDMLSTLKMVRDAEETGQRRGEMIGELKAGMPREKGGMMEVAQSFAGPFFKMLEKRQELAAGNPPQQSPPMANQLPPTTSTDTTAPLSEGYGFLAPMRPFYPQLAAQAQSNVDPEIIADFVLAKMSAEHLHAIQTAARRPDFIATMQTELAPIVTEFPDWVDDFLARIIEAATLEEEPDPPPTTKRVRAKK